MTSFSTILDGGDDRDLDAEHPWLSLSATALRHQRDLNIIKGDLVSILQETSDVRAHLATMSLRKPVLSKAFLLFLGFLLLIFVAALLVFQPSMLKFVSGDPKIL